VVMIICGSFGYFLPNKKKKAGQMQNVNKSDLNI